MKEKEEQEDENLSKEREKCNRLHEQVKELQQRNVELENDNYNLQGKVTFFFNVTKPPFSKKTFYKLSSQKLFAF